MSAPSDYREPGARPIWCPGCGLFGIHSSLLHALAERQVDRDRLALVSGIGCSSRLPFFVDAYAFHTVHGRALPAAVGLKTVRPDLTVVAVTGDGDGLSIGAGHFLHAARRNPDITLVMSNNAIYGMTKGQLSPTSPLGMRSPTSPLGSTEHPLDPSALAILAGATYVARGFPARAAELARLLSEALAHPGFAFVEVLAPCVTFNRAVGYQSIAARTADVPAEHDETDRDRALALALDPGAARLGRLFRIMRPTFHDRMERLHGAPGEPVEEAYSRLLSDLGP